MPNAQAQANAHPDIATASETYLTPKAFAERMELRPSRVYELIQRGEIRALRFGRQLRIPLNATLAAAERRSTVDSNFSATPAEEPRNSGQDRVAAEDAAYAALVGA